MKVVEIVLRGGAELRRILADDACTEFLAEIERRVGAVPLDAAGKRRRRKPAESTRLVRQATVEGHVFYVDPDEIAAISVDELELSHF